MNDILYVGIALMFFLASWGFANLCEYLGEYKSGEKV
jgi:hypothetical protein